MCNFIGRSRPVHFYMPHFASSLYKFQVTFYDRKMLCLLEHFPGTLPCSYSVLVIHVYLRLCFVQYWAQNIERNNKTCTPGGTRGPLQATIVSLALTSPQEFHLCH